jgi:hypothetical protein
LRSSATRPLRGRQSPEDGIPSLDHVIKIEWLTLPKLAI